MLARSLPVLVLALAGMAACASGGGSAPASAVTDLNSDVSSVRWAGVVSPVTEHTGDVRGGARIRVAGSAEMTPGISNNYTNLHVVFSSPLSSSSLAWALLPNRCGTDETPVSANGNFPAIELSAGGRGEAKTQIPFAFPTSGQYHVNVYNGQTVSLATVLGCANMEMRK